MQASYNSNSSVDAQVSIPQTNEQVILILNVWSRMTSLPFLFCYAGFLHSLSTQFLTVKSFKPSVEVDHAKNVDKHIDLLSKQTVGGEYVQLLRSRNGMMLALLEVEYAILVVVDVELQSLKHIQLKE